MAGFSFGTTNIRSMTKPLVRTASALRICLWIDTWRSAMSVFEMGIGTVFNFGQADMYSYCAQIVNWILQKQFSLFASDRV